MLSGTAGTAVRREDWGTAHAHALNQRGLSIETAVKHGWRPYAGPTDDLWVSIPYIEQGKVVGRKYRAINKSATRENFSQQPGSAQIFWNIDCLRDKQLAGFPLVITEGEIDALTAIQCGYPKTISVPGGAPERDAGDGPYWQYLAHAGELLKEQRPIVLAVDNDRNGKVLEAGLAKRLGRSRCQILEYPSGKDLNDVLMAKGERSVRETLALARYIPLPGLLRLSEIPDRPPVRAIDTCIPGLEPHLRIRRGDLIVITGPPGHGKSSFVINLCCNLAWHWKAHTAMASMEQAIVPDLRRVLRSFRAECLEKHMGDAQRRDADAWIDEHFVFLQADDGEDMTLPWLLERFAAARQRHQAGVCVIDPWNEVSVAGKPIDFTTEQWVSQSLREIKIFARKQDMTFIIVAHPAKMRRNRDGKTPKPGLWDIADSAAWANRCDAGVVIYRPDMQQNSLTEISIEKSRDFYAIGTPGMVSLQWQPETSRFVRP